MLKRSMFGAGAAFTAAASAQSIPAIIAFRGNAGSDQNIAWVRGRLEDLIEQLQRDRHDYDGHRVTAIGDMQQARTQLDAAIAWDRARGR